MINFTKEIFGRTKIHTNDRDIEKILQGIKTTPNLWLVIALARVPFNVAIETVSMLKEGKLIDFKKNGDIYFTQSGEKFAFENKIFPYDNFNCQSCSGRGISSAKLFELKSRFEEAVTGRPEPIMEYDQGYVSSDTAVARVALMANRGDIRGKSVLVLGDDDLFSIAAGLSGMPEEVVVLEVDERLIDFINRISKNHRLPVRAVHHDLKYKIPAEFVAKFDAFLCDPTETLEGLDIFIGRGLAGLKGAGCAGYFGLTYTESSLSKWEKFQGILNSKYSVVITDLIHDFNLYENWDYLIPSIRNDLPSLKTEPDGYWYRSSMYRVETLLDKAGDYEDKTGEVSYVDYEALVYTREDRKETA